jgi:hypothetical protein
MAGVNNGLGLKGRYHEFHVLGLGLSKVMGRSNLRESPAMTTCISKGKGKAATLVSRLHLLVDQFRGTKILALGYRMLD